MHVGRVDQDAIDQVMREHVKPALDELFAMDPGAQQGAELN